MRTIAELLTASLHDVFGNRDAERRAAVIEEIYTEDISFTDPDGTSRGRPAVAAKVDELLGSMPPEFRFSEAGPKYAGTGRGALPWELGPAGAPVARGVDVITVEEGRITAIVTMLAP